MGRQMVKELTNRDVTWTVHMADTDVWLIHGSLHHEMEQCGGVRDLGSECYH